MAIQFARIEIVGRSSGGNACCKGAYNARTIIKDQQTNITYNFKNRADNVYHAVLLPDHVDQKFKDPVVLMNEVERTEKRKNSQLLKDIVLALPDDSELNLKDKIEITYRLIAKREWVKNGLAVQVDIHKPHDGEKNWHAHLLLTTRRFTEDGKSLGAKAVDLNPDFKKKGNKAFIIPEDQQIHEDLKEIINDYFKELGLENRVDFVGIVAQEHIGPVRMRSVLNEAISRNEERRLANIEHFNSGQKVLDKVTNHMSVFTRYDLERAVKHIPNVLVGQGLVEEALADKSLLELFDENGQSTGYYTTIEIREEELKLLRLSNYVKANENILATTSTKMQERASRLLGKAKDSLSEEQHLALSQLLQSGFGINIMRGRAGTGKSLLLGKVASIYESVGVNVVGLAPTHQAKDELTKCGYAQTDTIKGMLFKLYNGRFELPKNSLLVVDEAGMVGNEDYLELLRVASSFKCNVILAGDERQLSSVQRGGMFEIFADSFGSSSLLNIKRQNSNWGKSVAMAFSKGDVRTGVTILDENERIISSKDNIASMETLLRDWGTCNEELENKLIIAVKNKDVDALNHGARQYLKARNYLLGKEFAVGGNHYMNGDRIIIKGTNKDLGLTNGDLAEIMEISKERCTILTAKGKEVSFDPNKYSAFKHGYATTIFKAQGQSINEVFVLHNGFSTIRNSYVALSRNIKDLRLYVNSETTRDTQHLIKQLSYNPDRGSSLEFFTKRDLEKRKLEVDFNAKKGIFASLVVGALDKALKKFTEITDKNLALTEYYQFKEPELKPEKVEQVLEDTYLELEQESLKIEAYGQSQMRKVVGGNSVSSSNGGGPSNIDSNVEATLRVDSRTSVTDSSNIEIKANKPKLSNKERFYANADYKRDASIGAALKENWDKEAEQLRQEVKFNVEKIARDLLGEPNRKLSNRRTLRFGENGKIAVRISGEKMGVWHDFSKSIGGDMFSLVQEQRGYDFKGTAEYLRQVVGMEAGRRAHLRLVDDHRNSDLITRQIKAQEAAEKDRLAKEMLVSKLEARAKPIGNKSIAHKYLTKIRNIECELSNDIKTAGIYYQPSVDASSDVNDKQGQPVEGKYLPAIIAFARDKDGNITGGQQILLDKTSGKKANVVTPKKSFGRIAGSFVDVGSINASDDSVVEIDKITIIAEGLETALSIKQALMSVKDAQGINIKVLCSLGISNIRNYQVAAGEKVIIAADNDGDKSNTKSTIDSAKVELEGRGAYVEVVRPNTEGDFNDLLVSGSEYEISNAFRGAITKHTAITLSAYIASCEKTDKNIKLDNIAHENLAYIQKYNLPEKGIVESYRKGDTQGAIALDQSRKSLEFAVNYYRQNKEMVVEATKWGYKGLEIDVTKAMLGMDEGEANLYCREIRDNQLEKYLEQSISEFSKQKRLAVNIEMLKPIMLCEQKFLKETYESLKSPIDQYSSKVTSDLKAGEIASKQPELLDKVLKTSDYIYSECKELVSGLLDNLSSFNDLGYISLDLAKKIEYYKVFEQPTRASEERLKSETTTGALSAIEKEQKLLAGLRGNIEYYKSDQELVEKVELAYTQRENKDFDKLETISKQALEVGAETPDTLLKKLQRTCNLEATYKNLDRAIEKHQINNQLVTLDKQISESQKPDEILQAIADKQIFLVTVEQNIKYPEQLDELLELSKSAKELESKQILKKLTDLVQQSLPYYSKESVVSLLKKATNLEQTCQKLEASIHSRDIDKHLLELDKQKQEAKTPIQVMGIVKQKQEFLAALNKKIKQPDLYKNELIHSVNEASHNLNTGNIAKLDKLVTFLEKSSNDPWVLTTLKSKDDLGSQHQSLLSNYQAKCVNYIKTSLDILDKGNHLNLDNKAFDCPTMFIDYLTKTRGNEYFPHKQVQNIKTKVIEKELELSKDLGLEL